MIIVYFGEKFRFGNNVASQSVVSVEQSGASGIRSCEAVTWKIFVRQDMQKYATGT